MDIETRLAKIEKDTKLTRMLVELIVCFIIGVVVGLWHY